MITTLAGTFKATPSSRLKFFIGLATNNSVVSEHLNLANASPKHWESVSQLADAIFRVINLHPDLPFKDIFIKCKSEIPSELNHQIDNLIEMPGTWVDFAEARTSPSYQGLIWAFRSVAKKDYHCHISCGLHETEIAEIMINHSQHLETMLKNLDPKNKYPAYLAKLRQACQLQDVLLASKLLRAYKPLRQWENKDFFITTLEILSQAVEIVTLRMLSDGVSAFELRINPIKPKLIQPAELAGRTKEEQLTHIARRVIEAATRGMEKALIVAKDEYQIETEGKDPKIFLGFNRGKGPEEYPEIPVSRIVEILLENIAYLLVAGPRVAGIDIAGMEFTAEDHPPNQWRRAIELTQASGLLVATHLGDISNVTEKSRHLFRLQNKSRHNPLYFEKLVSEHLRFVSGFVSLLPNQARIGHGFSLAPSFLSFAWPILIGRGLTSGMNMPDLTSFPHILQTTEELKNQLREKLIIIEHCPSASISSDSQTEDNKVLLYQGLPIHGWLDEGLIIKLGIDGIWYTASRPRTLSEEMARILLTSPKDMEVRNLLSLVK